MRKYSGAFFAFALLTSLLLDPADSDVAPNPMTGGHPVVRHEEETTTVRMVEEDVVVRIYADSIVTVGTFSMRNEGETVGMEVGFPFSHQNDIVRFRAFVDGQPVEVRYGEEEHSDSKGEKRWTTYWKLWDATFRGGETCAIRVEYMTKPLKWTFFRLEEHPALPDDVADTLRRAMITGTAEYTLETGKSWKGALDRCKVSFELAGMSDAHLTHYSPEDGTVTANGVVWEYTDYEPRGMLMLTYCPYMPLREIPDVLIGIVERFPDDPRLASEVGRFCANELGRKDVLIEIYHSFLAKWDEPIPQLMEYAPDGRCRFDYDAGNHFFTVWQMASSLFRNYGGQGEMEEYRDIAPTVARISRAIVDSLDTCGGLPTSNEVLSREAKEILELSNKLIEGRR